MTESVRIARSVVDGQMAWIETDEASRYYVLETDGVNPLPGRRLRALNSSAGALHLLPPFFGSKVLGLAYNYKSLVGERDVYDEPLFFLKSPTSVCLGGSSVQVPPDLDTVWVEGELTIVLRKGGRNIPIEHAHDHILGYTIASDMTARNVHGRDHHLARSKGLDQFCPIVPWVNTNFARRSAALETRINGKVFQSGDISDRIYDDAQSIALISRFVTLEPGDIILTGTPAGAMESLVRAGDSVLHTIAGLDSLEFTIVK